MSGDSRPASDAPALVRSLGVWDGALITIGSIIGTGIFITTGDIARVLPHPGMILLVFVVGGLLTVAGALTYAEMGVLFPRAGGQYHYLKEAYGPLWGFLFGWASFLVISSGGIATLAVGFGEYLGSFVPFFSTKNVLLRLPIGPWTWIVSGGQLAGVLAIALISAVNYVGLREGAGVQNAVTVLKVAAMAGLVCFGFAVSAPVKSELFAPLPLPLGSTSSALCMAMIPVLWTFDGWYNLTFSAGEMRNPERSLPWGLILGTLGTTVLYAVLNLVYFRALSVSAMAGTGRIGEAAAAALFGPIGSTLVSLAVLLSTFGCLSSSILCCSRIYLPMAQDGLFFGALARIHPRHFTPSGSIVAQGAWSALLALSGSYEQLYTYTMFVAVLFHAATGAAVMVLRRTRPDAPRSYRTWGYPAVPIAFILSALALVVNTLFEKPGVSCIGLGLLLLGLPAYVWWRRRSRRTTRVS
jgi:APA family basic amino acid/polyamine antiporter